jgi:hypothetical protein
MLPRLRLPIDISIDRFISTAIAEKLSALMTENYLKDRGNGNVSLNDRQIFAPIAVPDKLPSFASCQ